MVERRVCSFCGAEMEPGTGKLFVKKDGTVLTFDTNKCYKNMVELGRIPRRTEGVVEEKDTEVRKVKAKKVKKGAKAPKKKVQVTEYDGPAEEPAAAAEEPVEQPEEPVASEEPVENKE